MADDGRIVVGSVGKAHGLKGEVQVRAMTDLAARFAVGARLWVAGEATTVVASRPHKGTWLVRFDGVVDRNAAELLRGAELTADRDAARDDVDVFFADELVGMLVADEDGNVLGTVTDLVELPDAAGYDLLEVAGDDGTWLLPNADDLVVVATDPTDETHYLMVVDPPDGLLPS